MRDLVQKDEVEVSGSDEFACRQIPLDLADVDCTALAPSGDSHAVPEHCFAHPSLHP